MKRSPTNKNSGVILLVVLSMLTFFSVLVAAFLVFSNQARQASFAIASRNVKQSHPTSLLDEALMTLIRGTNDGTSPFFGEDLLSDYYGRTDFSALQVRTGTVAAILNNSFLRFSVANDTTVTGSKLLSTAVIDDLYTGRVITFTSGNLTGRSFRILRSISTGAGLHDFIVSADAELGAFVPVAGNTIRMNGVPRNAVGIGFNGTNVTATAPRTTAAYGNVGFSLPLAVQPNLLDDSVDKSTFVATAGSDFDESYDAADFNNWFLSYRDSSGVVVPSFHRPSVINYILNETTTWDAPPTNGYSDVVASIARGTFRPIPIAENQLRPLMAGGSEAVHSRFNGGNPSFALRAPLPMQQTGGATPNYDAARARLNQLASALIEGPWDVDNDFDGIPDSIWVDMGLPLVTSPEGKLLRPLIAPMIRDMSGRLNVNAHGNYALINQGAGVNQIVGDWAGTAGVSQFAFRGLGFGPAEINIPGTATQLFPLLRGRYQVGSATSEMVPGRTGVDALGILTASARPASLVGAGVYGNSVDPYGRGGYAMSLSGDLVPANDGDTAVLSPVDLGEALGDDPATTSFVEPTSDELVDNPYESDPTGRLSGDRRYTEDELEAIVRANEFDSEMLPTRLTELVRPLVTAEPGLVNAITTTSLSDDSPYAGVSAASAYDELRSLITAIGGAALTNAQLNDLVAPELRLAKRLDINRRIGNGVDDNANGVVDEPREYNVAVYDDDGNDIVDGTSETTGAETEAFQSYAGQTVDANFLGVAPDYVRDDSDPVPPRQLLARHLYVLMMIISDDLRNNYPGYGDMISPAVPTSDPEAYRARRLAQWAVNVVDYRDSDSIMTRFPYDPNPFDGWAVADDLDGDGVIDTTSTPDERFGTSTTMPTAQSPVVFGCEQPELLFTESYAMHDVRVRDTDLDTDNKKGNMAPDEDEDTDQVRIPQGSLFLELYCPRRRVIAPNVDPNTAGIPRELYDVNTSGTNVAYSLDLDRTITTYFDGTTWGDTSTADVEIPIWRIAISEPHFDTGTAANNPVGQGNSPVELRDTLPDTLSFQPELGNLNAMDEIDLTAGNLDLNRFVFFTDYASIADLQDAILPIPDITEQASVFFSRSGTAASLFPEQYLTIAPRVTTTFGSQSYTAGPTAPSQQVFEIQNTAPAVGLIQFDAAGTTLTPDTTTNILPGLSLPISGFAAGDWTNTAATSPNGIGLNVSEPLAINAGDYYAEPTNRYINAPNYPAVDAYVEIDSGANLIAGAVRDRPEDMRVNGPIRQLTEAFAADPATVADPMLGTVPNYRTAFLQRLADPTRGFHPTLNPYRTVDQIAIDLTIFSGEDTASSVTSGGNAPATPTTELAYATESRQRDGVGMNGVGSNVLYSYSTEVPATVAPPMAPGGTDFFNLGAALETTFNYLNTNFGAPVTTPVRGRPAVPFAMHPWLNRPYATPHELMLVPACSAGRLFEEFSVVDPANPDPEILPETSTTTTDPAYAETFVSPFRHLLNFFHSENVKHSGAAPAAEFNALFDFVGTPPPFRGESVPIPPALISATPLAPLYSAPFNFVEDNRRIGKVNLNTIEEFSTWKGLMQGHLNAGEYTTAAGAGTATQLSYNEFVKSRRGYVPTGTKTTVMDADATTPVNYLPNQLDPRFPTQFAGVFKRSTSGHRAPEVRNLGTTALDESEDLRRRRVNVGLLRAAGRLDEQESAGGTSPNEVSLFVRESTQTPAVGATNLSQDRNRNAFLKYQTVNRMPNLVSDNSQTFLVRMTLGFFEVDATNTKNLGAEYNEDKGENQRYHAMFIIDRSIPVGFIPGQDVNARDTVVFERYFQ
ncbi:hypothetical protein RISK_002859 [Rhodopirellula islandica]|uniref:Uncharacterized protein n=1 Tax=Rhodopirellula islandica TaxID=595434 RepID=A0A0J1BET0_RHOIS|nr:hypothetical protein [Rhodopirellula islandica]KLU05097.1 hypothetical protein RISK_002859 [Rhodopirellula islandica]